MHYFRSNSSVRGDSNSRFGGDRETRESFPVYSNVGLCMCCIACQYDPYYWDELCCCYESPADLFGFEILAFEASESSQVLLLQSASAFCVIFLWCVLQSCTSGCCKKEEGLVTPSYHHFSPFLLLLLTSLLSHRHDCNTYCHFVFVVLSFWSVLVRCSNVSPNIHLIPHSPRHISSEHLLHASRCAAG